MKRKKDKPILEGREKYDRRILIFFLFWVLLGLFVGGISDVLISGGERIGALIPSFLESLGVAFFFTGLLAFKYYRKRGIIPGKKILKGLAKIALVMGLVVAVGITLTVSQTTMLDNEFPDLSGPEMIGLFLAMYFFGFIFSFIMPIFFMIWGFGMMGVLCALTRAKTADLLDEITKITPNLSDSVKEKEKRFPGPYSNKR
jgi:hypothetical protein